MVLGVSLEPILQCGKAHKKKQLPVVMLIVLLANVLLPPPANRVKQRMLEIGDTLTGNIRLVSLATVYCLPWTRTSGIVADLKVLALHREKQGTQAHNNADF